MDTSDVTSRELFGVRSMSIQCPKQPSTTAWAWQPGRFFVFFSGDGASIVRGVAAVLGFHTEKSRNGSFARRAAGFSMSYHAKPVVLKHNWPPPMPEAAQPIQKALEPHPKTSLSEVQAGSTFLMPKDDQAIKSNIPNSNLPRKSFHFFCPTFSGTN